MPAVSPSSSLRRQRIVVNCGLPLVNRESWRQVARATAAHSTVTFNNASSSRFREDGLFRQIVGAAVIDGPSRVAVTRGEHPRFGCAARLP